jgi:acyl carrier protein
MITSMQTKPISSARPLRLSPLGSIDTKSARVLDERSRGRSPVTPEMPLQQRVIEVVTKSLGGAESKRVGPSASLTRDLRADALDKIEIILALEDAFDINISDLDAERVDTVRDAVDCVFHALNHSRR